MSRYRPPTPPGSKYITPQGAKRLRDELDQLWHDERPRVTAAVAEAAAQGDRSENAEYTYGKKRLHEIDRRVRFLRKRLEGMTIVDPMAAPGRRDPDADLLRRVGADRERPRCCAGIASSGRTNSTWRRTTSAWTRRLGRSLLGKRLGDEVSVALPGGATTFTVVAVSYGLKPPECS